MTDSRGGGRVPGWQQQLDDPAAPLFTIGVVADLLGVDHQVIRRLDVPGIVDCARPSGNQRRYSRNDIAVLSYALTLRDEGMPTSAIARILELEGNVAALRAGRAGATRASTGRR